MKNSALIIGIGKKPGGPPPPPPGMKDIPEQMGMSADKPDNDLSDEGDDSGKSTPEEALVVRAGHDCDDCKNYHADTGDCDKVSGQFSPEDSCLRFFEAKGGDEDDEMGGDENDSLDETPNDSGYGTQA